MQPGCVPYVYVCAHRHMSVSLQKKMYRIMETPCLLMSVCIGFFCIPEWLLCPYEYILKISCPLLVLMEGFSFVLTTLTFGRWLIHRVSSLEEQTDHDKFDENEKSPLSRVYSSPSSSLLTATKVQALCVYLQAYLLFTWSILSGLLQIVVLLSSFCVFVVSSVWIYSIVAKGNITHLSAGLLSSSLTVFVVLVVLSFLSPDTQMIITDSVLIYLYIAYNVWIMARSSKGDGSFSLMSFVGVNSAAGDRNNVASSILSSSVVSWPSERYVAHRAPEAGPCAGIFDWALTKLHFMCR